MKLPEPSSGSYTPTPAGQHNAVLTRFIDLGTQTTNGQYGTKHQHKVLLAWELPGERVEWEKDGVQHSGPVLHHERLTFSSHEKAKFRQYLEMWRGKPFTDEDFGVFDCRSLLGVGAFLQIAHETNNGKIYANLQAIMLPPGGKDSWAKPEGGVTYFSLSEFDQEVFDGLSEGLQSTIKDSPEYKSMFSQDPGPSGSDSEDPSGGLSKEIEDEIPF
jgi:hypothetical protein